VSYIVLDLQALVYAIACEGVGTDGSLNTPAFTADKRAIPANVFRPSTAPLDDSVDPAKFHRSVRMLWDGDDDSASPEGEDDATIELFYFTLQNGVVEGGPAYDQVNPINAHEDRVAVVENAEAVGLSDCLRLREALCCPTLYGSRNSSTLYVDYLRTAGRSRARRLPSGRLVYERPYVLCVSYSKADAHVPEP